MDLYKEVEQNEDLLDLHVCCSLQQGVTFAGNALSAREMDLRANAGLAEAQGEPYSRNSMRKRLQIVELRKLSATSMRGEERTTA